MDRMIRSWFLLINLCQIMALKLVDQKNVSITDIIKIVIDQKLFPPEIE